MLAVIEDRDLDYIELLLTEGVAAPALIVSAVVKHVRACSFHAARTGRYSENE
jgi:hypothetical protein